MARTDFDCGLGEATKDARARSMRDDVMTVTGITSTASSGAVSLASSSTIAIGGGGAGVDVYSYPYFVPPAGVVISPDPAWSVDTLADLLMDRIEKDQAIHRDSLVDVICMLTGMKKGD